MNTTRPRLVAAALLTLGGMTAAVGATLIVLARFAAASGMDIRPADVQLVDDLAALLPFIGAFIAVDLATARGLARGRAWAIASASVLSLGTATMAAFGLLLVVVGTAPSAIAGASHGAAEAIGLIAGFGGIYLTALMALRLDGLPAVRPRVATT
ncbi:MAG TPA: hypothetical protein VFW02_11465 [Candidatus Limnocylindrales bacterium]|nr:hypothetical protein [Candidatus Limnocylindrales bacterium]